MREAWKKVVPEFKIRTRSVEVYLIMQQVVFGVSIYKLLGVWSELDKSLDFGKKKLIKLSAS